MIFVRWTALTVVVLLLLPACGAMDPGENDTDTDGTDPLGGDPVLPPEPASLPPSAPGITVAGSGSRLRPVVLKHEDAVSFLVWRDTALDVDCEFVPTEQGLRCLPAEQGIVLDGPDCTVPMAYISENDPLDSIVVHYENGNCAVQYRAFRVTGEPEDPNPACYGGDAWPPPAVRSLTPIDPAEFVAGTIGAASLEGWGDYRLDAEDGAWRILGAAHDGEPCDLRTLGEAGVCLDTRAWIGGCGPQTPVACEPVAHVLTFDDCDTDVTAVYEVNAGQPADACGEHMAGGLVFEVGTMIPVSALPGATAGLLGTGRVRVRAIADSTGSIRWPENKLARGPWTTLFDARFGLPCSAYSMVDGPLRCMPSIGIGHPEHLFADPECRLPAYPGTISYTGPEACELVGHDQADPIIGVVLNEDNEIEYHGVVPHDGPIYRADDGCTETALPHGVSRMFRAAGGELPDDIFATVERVTLP